MTADAFHWFSFKCAFLSIEKPLHEPPMLELDDGQNATVKLDVKKYCKQTKQ